MNQSRIVIALLAFGVAIAGAAVLSAAPAGFASDLESLASTSPAIRKATMAKLEKGGATTASALIDELEEDHSPTVKGAIAQIVRTIGAGSADAADLRDMLASRDPVVRKAAAVILTSNPRLATSELITVATNAGESASIRCSAIRALGAAGTSASSTLTELSGDASLNRSIRAAAITALAETSGTGAIAVRKIAEDLTRTEDDRVIATTALGESASKGHGELKSLATNPTVAVRAAAAAAIEASGDATLLGAVAGRLADANADVRLVALQATINMGGEDANKATIKGLVADADPRVQALAIQSVGRSYKSSASSVANALKGQLVNANFRVRYEAALALKAHGDTSGLATMAADKLSPNPSQATLAAKAHTQINGK